jgi:hypothetical protein
VVATRARGHIVEQRRKPFECHNVRVGLAVAIPIGANMSVTKLEHESEGVAYEIAPVMTIDEDEPDADAEPRSQSGRKAATNVARAFFARAIIVWSICELALEAIVSATTAECIAALLGRVIWISLAVGTIYGHRFSERLLIYVCAASALAVSVQLPSLFKMSEVFFGVSLVDCLLKGMTLIAFLPIQSAMKTHTRL